MPVRTLFPSMLAALALACLLCLAGGPADARVKGRTDRVRIAYVPPKNPEHQPILDVLKARRILEQVREVLSPIRLPRALLIKVEGCDGVSNAWYENDVVTICYEYLADIWRNAPAETTPSGVTRHDALLGPFADVVLHEVGHALFEMLEVPVLGREEDAADQVSAYIMLRFGKDDQRRLIGGTAYSYAVEILKSGTPPKLTDFADEHGTPAQRFFNVLCIAYGADPKTFGDLVEKGYLPKGRAEGCEDEYKALVFAFDTLIGPRIDQRRARKAHGRSWKRRP